MAWCIIAQSTPSTLNFYNIVPNSLSFTLFQTQITSPETSLCIYNPASEVGVWLWAAISFSAVCNQELNSATKFMWRIGESTKWSLPPLQHTTCRVNLGLSFMYSNYILVQFHDTEHSPPQPGETRPDRSMLLQLSFMVHRAYAIRNPRSLMEMRPLILLSCACVAADNQHTGEQQSWAGRSCVPGWILEQAGCVCCATLPSSRALHTRQAPCNFGLSFSANSRAD